MKNGAGCKPMPLTSFYLSLPLETRRTTPSSYVDRKMGLQIAMVTEKTRCAREVLPRSRAEQRKLQFRGQDASYKERHGELEQLEAASFMKHTFV